MKKYILIGIFGIAGAMFRYGTGLLFHSTFPWGTLTVNFAGCLLLPFIFIFIRDTGILSKELVTALGTGFIGAFTTFSSFTVDIVKLIGSGWPTLAAVYLGTSLASGMIAAYVSVKLSTCAVDKYLKKEIEEDDH